MSLLAVEKLSITFNGVVAVKRSSFTIEKGEILALVGESGSGKSLTALACLGLQPANAALGGSIRFDGQELVGATDAAVRPLRGARIGMIFQEPMTALNPLHTIGRQIGEMFGSRIHSSAAREEKVIALLEQVGLPHFSMRLNAYPHQCSGGERQRIMIAMAIANRPDLLIADEPTTAVDVTLQVKILTLLKELQQSLQLAILFITHDLTVVRAFADRVAVMHQGEIVEQGRVAELFANPKHDYTRHLIASEPQGLPVAVKAGRDTLLACEELRVYFPVKTGLLHRTSSVVKAVDNVSLSIAEGQTVGIVGESGSGKTTLGFALLRLIKGKGRIVFLGQDLQNFTARALRPLRKQMQVVFQDPYSSLNPRMTIRQIIGEGLLLHMPELTAAQREERLDAILREVGLSPDMKERYPHEFSGGQRQRISIARAMILKPRFVVLDEPTSALDLSVQIQIMELLKNLQREHGLSYLFISHDLRVVKAIAHRLVVMHKGIVVEHGDTGQIFANPQHDYTRSLIHAAFIRKATAS